MADPREDVVNRAIERFSELQQFSVQADVGRYILDEVIRPTPDFVSGLQYSKFTNELVEEAIARSLAAAKDSAIQRGLPAIDLDAARIGFQQVVEAEMKCPYPFMIC